MLRVHKLLDKVTDIGPRDQLARAIGDTVAEVEAQGLHMAGEEPS